MRWVDLNTNKRLEIDRLLGEMGYIALSGNYLHYARDQLANAYYNIRTYGFPMDSDGRKKVEVPLLAIKVNDIIEITWVCERCGYEQTTKHSKKQIELFKGDHLDIWCKQCKRSSALIPETLEIKVW